MMVAIAIICALLSIIPAGIVFLTMHTHYNELMRRYDALKRDQDILTRLESASTELYALDNRRAAEIESVKESLTSLANKLASRARTDRRAERDEPVPTIDAPEETSAAIQMQGNGTSNRRIAFIKKPF